MITAVTRRYHFESAHWLPGVPDSHKCHRIHGHNYEVEITLKGEPDERGFVLDFFELDTVMLPIVGEIDHRTLNDIAGLENPTAELIAAWFHQRVSESLGRAPASWPQHVWIDRVRIYETKDCWADVSASWSRLGLSL
jgi:6-pyruvoyltetrahydropterin/6-carboxytetrahydropterin synthase